MKRDVLAEIEAILLGSARVYCAVCGAHIGRTWRDPAGRANAAPAYGYGPPAQGRERVRLPCPTCNVVRASNTAKSLQRQLKNTHTPIAH